MKIKFIIFTLCFLCFSSIFLISSCGEDTGGSGTQNNNIPGNQNIENNGENINADENESKIEEKIGRAHV